MRWRLVAIAAVVCLAWTAAGAVLLWPDSGDRDTNDEPAASAAAIAGPTRDDALSPEPSELDVSDPELGGDPSTSDQAASPAPSPEASRFAVDRAEPPYRVSPKLKRPPSAGLLFDVDSGEVLWAHRPEIRRPIASLTKMMTALLIAERHRPGERVLVTRKAVGVEGSRIGVLRPGRRVPLRGLFAGLILASGNDAAAALARHDAGSIAAFVARMNERAAELGLECTRFAGPSGLQDRGNRSCAYDLAALARADLADRWVAATVRRRALELSFPVKGGTLSLANNHYFVQRGVPGVPGARVTGVKTGYTDGAGRCYVTSARLGGAHLGVVLLDSEDPLRQVPALLRAGFVAQGVLAPGVAKRGPDPGRDR